MHCCVDNGTVKSRDRIVKFCCLGYTLSRFCHNVNFPFHIYGEACSKIPSQYKTFSQKLANVIFWNKNGFTTHVMKTKRINIITNMPLYWMRMLHCEKKQTLARVLGENRCHGRCPWRIRYCLHPFDCGAPCQICLALIRQITKMALLTWVRVGVILTQNRSLAKCVNPSIAFQNIVQTYWIEGLPNLRKRQAYKQMSMS